MAEIKTKKRKKKISTTLTEMKMDHKDAEMVEIVTFLKKQKTFKTHLDYNSQMLQI